MTTRENSQNNTQSADYSDENNWPQGEEADFMMECLMGNYLMKNEVVRAKLHHARQATRKNLDKLEKLIDDTNPDTAIKELGKAKKLDVLWTQLVQLLSEIGLAEEDIADIETTITKAPKNIRDCYDILLEQDRNLSNLIYEMESDTFADAHEQARDIREKIQSQPNPMSGLMPEEYEPAAADIRSSSGVEIITLPNFRKGR